MFVSPLRSIQITPKICSWLKQARHVRPSIKIGKETFQICLDVHQFKKNELCVKARPDYVVIEGKLERKTKTGKVVKQFVRKFRLPEGCNHYAIRSELSCDGLLKITAPRQMCDPCVPCETVIPISYSGPCKDCTESIIPVNETKTKAEENKKPS